MTTTTTAEFDRPVLCKRVCWDEPTANTVADAWERDGYALGVRPHSVGVFPVEVECGRPLRAFTLYIVLAYGALPYETA